MPMKNHDTLQPFLFKNANIRGCVINLSKTYQTIINQRPYPDQVKKLLGEAMLGCLFLSSSMKFEGKLNLQFQGDERLPLLVVQCDDMLNLRAMAKYSDSLNTKDYDLAFQNGKLSLTLSPSNKTNTYTSIVPINSGSMQKNLMNYFTQSEQIPSQIWLASSDQQVAGIILQLMPGENIEQQEQLWEYALAIGETIQENELLNLESLVLLQRLYHETDICVFDSRKINFKCRCNKNKIKDVILMLGEKEVQQMLLENSSIKINCDFCNHCYNFDAIDIAALFHPKSIVKDKYPDPNIEIIKEIKS